MDIGYFFMNKFEIRRNIRASAMFSAENVFD